jgi:hypothetical protein
MSYSDIDTSITTNERHLSEEDHATYRKLVGSLLYVANGSRPDVAYACSTLGQFLSKPKNNHLKAAFKVLKYLTSTAELALHYPIQPDAQLYGYTDADFAACKMTSRSRCGYIFKLGDSTITWCSQKQTTVSQSTCESEFYGITASSREGLSLRRLLFEMLNFKTFPDEMEDKIAAAVVRCRPKNEEIRQKVDGFHLLVDNVAAIHVATDLSSSKVMKHVRVREHFVREHVKAGRITLKWVQTRDQVADIFTKPLSKDTFVKLRRMLGFRTAPRSD